MCPWIPASFFEAFLDVWAAELGEEWELLIDSSASGPTKSALAKGSEPLSSGSTEAAIVCAPTFLWAALNRPPRAELAGWTPVFEEGEAPHYHSIVLVAKSHPARSLTDLGEARWCFNDPCSLSGYFSVLASLGGDTTLLQTQAQFSGGHYESVEALLSGQADACAVDYNGWVLQHELRQKALPYVREVAKLGPFVAPPIVLSLALEDKRRKRLKKSLSQVVQRPKVLQKLSRDFSLKRFAQVRQEHFQELHQRLRFLTNP